MRVSLRGWCSGTLVGLALTLPLSAQPAPQDPAPADDGVDVALPHLARINGPGAVVQRDVDEVEAVAGEHLAFGDRVTTGDAQVQVVWSDGSLVSLDRRTSMAVLSPELLAVTEGRAIVVTPAAATLPLRIDTPAGTVLAHPGTDVRVAIEASAIADVQVAHGRVDIRHPEAARTLAAGQQITLRDGVAPGEARAFNTAAFDSFVEWAREPVVLAERSPSRAYLGDPRLDAYADVFDRYGQWDQDPTYGQVWFPTVGADWRPYSQGYWQPFGGAYGPTWVGLDPWGWPTHHYGAWDVGAGGRWFWRPGRRWSPGRVTWSIGPGYVGWSPRGLRQDSRWAWSRISVPSRATQRGVYPGGTLDPFRAWTVVPSERYGRRGGVSAYAVDARTLLNLDAFVTQRVAPPVRYGYGSGYGASPVLAVPPGTRYPGRASGRGGYGTPTGVDTNSDLRGGIAPTRVAPAGPGAGPTPPPDDPYERARGMMVPRGRTRTPPAEEGGGGAPRRQPPATGETPRQSAPRSGPPPAAAPAEAPPAEAPPARGVGTRQPTGRTAVPRPPA